jgi:hypothetical protein
MSQTTYNISMVICADAEERWTDHAAAGGSVEQQTLLLREIVFVIVLLRHNGIHIISAALLGKTAGCCNSSTHNRGWKEWCSSDVYYV